MVWSSPAGSGSAGPGHAATGRTSRPAGSSWRTAAGPPWPPAWIELGIVGPGRPGLPTRSGRSGASVAATRHVSRPGPASRGARTRRPAPGRYPNDPPHAAQRGVPGLESALAGRRQVRRLEWSCGESNPGPTACKAVALPTELQPRTRPVRRLRRGRTAVKLGRARARAIPRSGGSGQVDRAGRLGPEVLLGAAGLRLAVHVEPRRGRDHEQEGHQLLHLDGPLSVLRGRRGWAWEDLNLRPHPYQGCALTG